MQEKPKSLYPTVWPVTLTTEDYGETLFRLTLDDEFVELSYEEFKRRVLQSHLGVGCLSCMAHKLRLTSRIVRGMMGEA